MESVPGVRAAIPRMIINGLVSSAAGNRMLFLQGIDPERELALRDLSEDVEVGELPGCLGEGRPHHSGRRHRREARVGAGRPGGPHRHPAGR